MEISTVNGRLRNYRYEGLWWRADGEVHWKAEVFLDDDVAANPKGSLRPATPGNEDEEVRQSIEAFIETADETARRHSDPGAL